MRKTILLLSLILVSTTLLAQDLQKQLEALASSHEGNVAFFAKNLSTGATVAIDADRPVQTASVIKLPLFLQAFEQVKDGKIHLDDKVELTKANQVAGSG